MHTVKWELVIAAVENNMETLGETVPSPVATVHYNNLVKGFFLTPVAEYYNSLDLGKVMR